jgi:hypothetical protein
MSRGAPTGPLDPAQAALDLARLARATLGREPGGPDAALAALARLRAEVDAIAATAEAAGGEAALLPPLRRALLAAGLEGLVPEGAPLAAVRAALARLHGLAAALAVAGAGKAPRARDAAAD